MRGDWRGARGRDLADMHVGWGWGIFVVEYEASNSDDNLFSEKAEHRRFLPQSANSHNCWNTPRLGCGGIGLKQWVDYICRRAGES